MDEAEDGLININIYIVGLMSEIIKTILFSKEIKNEMLEESCLTILNLQLRTRALF